MKYHDNNSIASDPVNINLSHKKLMNLNPDLYGFKGLFKRTSRKIIEEHIYYGDSQPAIVISTEPLLIAAYSDELDCIALLHHPQQYVKEYCLEEKTKLLTINTYFAKPPYQKDLIIGLNQLGNWYGFFPIIAEFVSEDIKNIQKRKLEIGEEKWSYVYNLGLEYRRRYKDTWRDGRPLFSRKSAL